MHHYSTEKWFTTLFSCLVLLLLTTGCTPPAPDTRSADENTIRVLDAKWSNAAGANDLEGTVSFYSDDAALLPPNAPIANGKQEIRAVWATLLVPGTSVSWQPTKVEVARSGDLAYLRGTYLLTMKDAKGNPVTDHGKMVEVWKKQPDGQWKTVADIFNSDLPAAAPAEQGK
jgi:uncharacterized protein (TIGR02246 family)